MAKIILNGEPQEVTLPLTVAALLEQNQVQQPDMISVQLNETFVDKDARATTQLKDGDAVDFLYFMGGGAYL